MTRSLKKGPYVDEKLMKKALQAKSGKGAAKPIKTWARRSTITPEMVGLNFLVHNGRDFLSVFVEENMVGHKLGEFSPTRKFIVHGGKMAKEQAKEETAKPAGAVAAPGAAPAAKPPAANKK